MLRRSPFAAFLLLGLPFVLIACGDDSDGTGMPDMDVDMQDIDMPEAALPVCDPGAIVELASTGSLGETVTIDLDTTDRAARDLSGCGAAGDASGQIAVRYTVPGSGDVALDVSTVGGATDGSLETVVQVRTDSCESPAGICVATPGAQADGVAIVPGGTTVHFIVTANDGEGAITLRVTAEQATTPVLDSYTVIDLRPEEGTAGFTEFAFTGSDAAADVVAFELTVLDSTGNPFPLTMDNQTTITLALADPPVTNDFTTITRLVSLNDFFDGDARAVRIALVDSQGSASNTIEEDIVIGSAARLGETCSDTALCIGTRIECFEEEGVSTCVPDTVLTGLCADADANAIDLTGLTPTTGVAAPLVSAIVPEPDGPAGAASSPCVTAIAPLAMFTEGNNLPPDFFTAGPETAFRVDLPAGAVAYDVTVTLEVPENGAGTLGEAYAIYGRTNCVDSFDTSLACYDEMIDDMAMLLPGGPRPSLTFEDQLPGSFYVFIEPLLFGGINFPGMVPGAPNAGMDLEALFTVIPILSGGTACDPNAILNRCAIGACPTIGDPVCP